MGAASSPNWRASARPNTTPAAATTTTTGSTFSLRSSSSFSSLSSNSSSSISNVWERRGSRTSDSGYESLACSHPASLSQSSLSQCDCHEYAEVYRSYKEQERVVRRWLCKESARECEESKLDNIDVGSLVRMAERLSRASVPFSVSQGLRKAIEGRKAVIGRWHSEHTDRACSVCPRVWRQLDESHSHHIRELERMLVILGIVKPLVKPKVDPRSLQSWR